MERTRRVDANRLSALKEQLAARSTPTSCSSTVRPCLRYSRLPCTADRYGNRSAMRRFGGLTVATFITLLMVPVLYAIFVLDLKVLKWQTKDSNNLGFEEWSTCFFVGY